MAFETELVLAAQTAPPVEVITSSLTTGGNTGSWSVSMSLPPGQWLVAIRGRAEFSESSSADQRLEIDGVERFVWRPSGGRCSFPTASAVVGGGRSVTLAHTASSTSSTSNRLGGSHGWDFTAARVG